MRVVTWAWILLAATSAFADAPAAEERTLVMTVFDQKYFLDQVTPAEAEVKRKELPPDEFSTWLRTYRGRRLYELAWGHVGRKFREQEKIDVGQEELAAIAESVKRRLEEQPNPNSTFSPEEQVAVGTAWQRASLMDWKVCRALHKKYGGRVGIGSLGAWIAFDGQNALLREHHQAGDIQFHDASLEQAFWEHTAIKNFADAYPTGERLEQLLATPPYLQH